MFFFPGSQIIQVKNVATFSQGLGGGNHHPEKKILRAGMCSRLPL